MELGPGEKELGVGRGPRRETQQLPPLETPSPPLSDPSPLPPVILGIPIGRGAGSPEVGQELSRLPHLMRPQFHSQALTKGSAPLKTSRWAEGGGARFPTASSPTQGIQPPVLNALGLRYQSTRSCYFSSPSKAPPSVRGPPKFPQAGLSFFALLGHTYTLSPMSSAPSPPRLEAP